MAITYTWEITSLRTRTEGENLDAVVQTYWKKTGTDENGNSGTFEGATPFSAASVPAGEFIPFAELTEETVLNWIKSVVVDDYEQHVNTKIQEKIDSASTSQPELPWAPGKGAASIAEPGATSVNDSSLAP
jgi:hypothetical protein